ncbi:clustered mitochondria protein homolog [Brienomyrus brachyistius]|uniref:clustered mitochondria protein homolog n=1 Tax=Brienomyrus brachyistius TaxID=42636 RepID=UPI0020B1E50E|nr:clustered mitochondria protein homolog [Brienomyrus brachyistius]
MKDKVQPAEDSIAKLANGSKLPGNAMGLKLAGEEEDVSFPVKIQGAGVEPFELQVHRFWLVQDAVMAVLGREEVAPRTSLSLSLSGTILDPICELQTIKGLKPGATLRLVEDSYTPRTIRVHLAHLQDFLRAPSPQDALREGRSPSLLNTLSPAHNTENTPGGQSGRGARRLPSDSKPEQQTMEGPPPDYILPGSKERPLVPLLPNNTHSEVPNCLIDLSLSCWNPPPGTRKLQGDFLYITVCTLEGRWCDITSCPKGFFLNRSTLDVFDPRPASSSPPTHCLSDLLSQISSGFKKAFTALRNRSQPPPLENMPTPYRTLSWLGPPSAVRCHRNSFTRSGLEEQGVAQAPDWNEELQTARDLPQGSLEERLHRDRVLLQVNSAFVWAAAQAVEAVVDGCVTPINGGVEEDPAFLCGGLFVSRGGASEGGERANRAAQRLELQGVQEYSNLLGHLLGLHTLPSAVVDYRGSRLLVQGLAPGLDSMGGEARGLLYGVSAAVSEGPQRRKLLELLAHAAKTLNIQKHVVLSPSGQQVPLFSSIHTQGLLGADGRLYLLNLFHVHPADANYHVGENEEQAVQEEAQADWLEYCSSRGFPRCFPHKFCLLRPELIQAFIQHKQSQFTQRVKERMEESGGIAECTKTGDPRGTEAIRGACKDVGSVSNIIFEMRFNPDVFCPGVQFPSSESSSVQLQETLLKEAASFLITNQIPAFLDDCLQFRVNPVDGATLCKAMHQKGINLRYLGELAIAISQSEHRERLQHVTRLVFGEIVIRSAKRIFSSYVQNVEVSSLSAAVSHFLCCLLVPHLNSISAAEESKKRSKKRGRGGGATSDTMAWSTFSGTELWGLLNQDARDTYHLTEGLGTSADYLMEQYGLQKFSLLRGLCLKTGVQLRLRDYTLDNCIKAPISPDDIINMFPVVKHVTMTTSDATQAFNSAQKSIEKGQLDRAYEQLKEATYLFGRVCDDLHPEASMCLSTLAQVAYLQGNRTEARSVQMKAVVLSERVLGFDHPSTIQEYALLAMYVFAGQELGLAQRCLYRARLLMLLVHGEEHPYMATLDSSLGLVLQGEQSVRYLQSALRLNTMFRGLDDLHTALNQHLLAQRLCCIGDYRKAISHEKQALAVFQAKFGDNHVQTKCSTEFLKAVTQQAVRVERSLRQGGSDLMDTVPPPESLIPSKETTLEQLAIVNGILKVSVSDKIQEIKEKLRELRATADTNSEKAEPSNDEEAGSSPADEAAGSSPADEAEAAENVTVCDVSASSVPEENTQQSNHLSEKLEHAEEEAQEATDHHKAGETATMGKSDKPGTNAVNGEGLEITDQSGTAPCNGEGSLGAGDDKLELAEPDTKRQTSIMTEDS